MKPFFLAVHVVAHVSMFAFLGIMLPYSSCGHFWHLNHIQSHIGPKGGEEFRLFLDCL